MVLAVFRMKSLQILFQHHTHSLSREKGFSQKLQVNKIKKGALSTDVGFTIIGQYCMRLKRKF